MCGGTRCTVLSLSYCLIVPLCMGWQCMDMGVAMCAMNVGYEHVQGYGCIIDIYDRDI